MMDHEDFEDDDVIHIHAPAFKFTKWVFLMHFFGMLMGIFNTIGVFFEGMVESAVAAANKGEMETQFHEEAAIEIETLTKGVE